MSDQFILLTAIGAYGGVHRVRVRKNAILYYQEVQPAARNNPHEPVHPGKADVLLGSHDWLAVMESPREIDALIGGE